MKNEVSNDTMKPSSSFAMNDALTNWKAIYISAFIMVLAGINISIYYMAIWPYAISLMPNLDIATYGWLIASNSVGCIIANPLFGWWGQKVMKAAHPVACAFALGALGNFLYAILPVLPPSMVFWTLMCSRFLCGFGAGIVGVMRAFAATACAPKDKLTAISYSSFGWTMGLSIGPTIQLLFMPAGSGWTIKGLVFNQYTLSGFFLSLTCLLCIIILFTIFEENYTGIISDAEKNENPWVVIPKFDRIPILILFFIWSVLLSIGAAFYTTATPVTMTLYAWSSEEAVFRNATLQTLSCGVSGIVYLLLARTRYGKMDRRITIIWGFSIFVFFCLVTYPWWFYAETVQLGQVNGSGCPITYSWCEGYHRAPFWLYGSGFVLALGVAFPTVIAPLNALFSEILGPRKQSFLQGLLTFCGSLAQFFVPLYVMPLFEISGFRYPAMVLLALCASSIGLIILYFKRMVPLEMIPPVFTATKYKRGTFYKL